MKKGGKVKQDRRRRGKRNKKMGEREKGMGGKGETPEACADCGRRNGTYN